MVTPEIIEASKQWLTSTFDAETQKEIQDLIDNNPEELTDRFYKNMEFGTGGMRGVMGAGTNRINKYTLGKATQGLSDFLIQNNPNKELSTVIAYDCRHNSKEFAKVVADVFTANGIKVFLFDDLRTTPELSFAVRYLKADAGIVLTASHNPPEYNGYKVYGADGCQITPPNDGLIINEVNKVSFDKINFNANEDLLTYIGEEVDNAFNQVSVDNGTFGDVDRSALKIVFTALHGTSIKSVPQVLDKAGFSDVHIVEEQATPNGDFPTVKSPNPEEPEALEMATSLANKIGADILMGCDPDSDRLGIAVRDLEGNMKLLNGNQTMILMTDFLINQKKKAGKLNGTQFTATTIVSSEMVKVLADHYGIDTVITLTGFKWIGKAIADNPSKDFVGGGEESFGYMIGDFVRDKDAVTSCLLACEMAAHAKANGTTLYKQLLDIYIQHGYYKESLISITKKGMDGATQIQEMIADFRANPMKEILGSPVKYVCDYESSIKKNLITGEETTIDIPKSNVLIYHTEDGTKVCVRPSGTEPKIKFYFGAKGTLTSHDQAETVEAQLDQKIKDVIVALNLN
ncbi:phospho-sugar mutase [Wenyingzhuangia marina]|uniref:Phosphoglucomutase n=1 Tax=Wenyingzhuangia marina TaxID=1195760 RepID=A0A1M5WQ74_9FLAO|nr:phospho-sugar mutase [Wenyingzhuangia marina]GGF79934.1 phosphoglucomutase [Wenyingzhuangia marina]SHH89648.1 phosphoglucomutase [Wenyingzhuangia marina]